MAVINKSEQSEPPGEAGRASLHIGRPVAESGLLAKGKNSRARLTGAVHFGGLEKGRL